MLKESGEHDRHRSTRPLRLAIAGLSRLLSSNPHNHRYGDHGNYHSENTELAQHGQFAVDLLLMGFEDINSLFKCFNL